MAICNVWMCIVFNLGHEYVGLAASSFEGASDTPGGGTSALGHRDSKRTL